MDTELKIEIPFERRISFKKLIELWQHEVSEGNSAWRKETAGKLLAEVSQIPEFDHPQDSIATFEPHADLVRSMLTLVVSSVEWESNIIAVGRPLSFDLFLTNDHFENVAFSGMDHFTHTQAQFIHETKMLQAYATILNTFYDFDIDFQTPITVEVPPGRNNDFKKVYRLSIVSRFCWVEPIGELPVLTDNDRSLLLDHLTDLELLKRKIPAEKFEFHGFAIIKGTDVTEQAMVSELKQYLLDKNTIVDTEKLQTLQAMMSQLFKIPDVNLWLVAINGTELLMLSADQHSTAHCIYEKSQHFNLESIRGSVFEKALLNKEIICINRLEDQKGKHPIYDKLFQHGKRSVVLAPLVAKEEVIGILGLSTEHTGDFNLLNTRKLSDLLPLFAIAVKNGLEEFEARINAIIQENFTSIHPAVLWRFKNAAKSYVEKLMQGETAEMEDIVFSDIFPLYCVSDIRGSSEKRNQAIETDLIDHLSMVGEIVDIAGHARGYPLFDELKYRIEKNIANIRKGLQSGDEIKIINFIRNDIESYFREFRTYNAAISAEIDRYYREIETNMGTFYHRRKAYDSSVARINQVISTHLEEAQKSAQEIIPHYFDKQVTDGVDQSMYVGKTLSENGSFNTFHLKNLRLWQFMTLHEIAVKIDSLREELPIPLEMTHLIMVQDMPISIRFDADENKFRVDGAYNIRYEIMKKRIDKATIRSTNERLTQPGRIAIVYSHDSESHEYYEYIDYLVAKNYLEPAIEEHDLNDLQGIKGLKALRVKYKAR